MGKAKSAYLSIILKSMAQAMPFAHPTVNALFINR
jgi:hypothetical protein